MLQIRILAVMAAAFSFTFAGLQGVALAELVKVEGVHLCCGGCVKGVNKALTGVTGVTDVKVEQDDETVTFQAKDEAAVLAGLTALSKGGYYGKTSSKGPEFKIDKNAKQNTVNVSDLHLCCGGCTQSVEAALKGVKGVKTFSAQAKMGKVTVTGENISLAETLAALHDAGFHGTIK